MLEQHAWLANNTRMSNIYQIKPTNILRTELIKLVANIFGCQHVWLAAVSTVLSWYDNGTKL